MMKKLILVLVFAYILSGCGRTESPIDGERVVSLGITNGNEAEQESLNRVLQNIESKYGIRVETKIYTNHETQLRAELAGGVAPDVFYVDALMFPGLVESNMLAQIPQNIKDESNLDDFYPNLLSAFSHNEGLYGFPKDFSALGVFYNERLLNEAGYTVGDIPENFEDWYNFLQDLQEKLPSGVVALSSNLELARYMSLIQASGEKVHNEDGTSNLVHDKVIEPLEYITSMYINDFARTPAEMGNDWVGNTFGLENAVIAIEGNWIIGHLERNFPDVEYGVIEMPKYFGNNNALSFTVSYSINANSRNIEDAYLLAMHLTDEENMRIWCEGAGVLPSRASVSYAMELENDPIQQPLMRSAEYATPWQAGITLPIINREFNNWIPLVASGQMSAREAMEEANSIANEEIINMIS